MSSGESTVGGGENRRRVVSVERGGREQRT